VLWQSAYVHHKEVKAALGVKVTAPDLEKAIAGSRLLVVGPDDDEDDLRDEVMSDLTSLLNSIDKSGRGVCVQASTLGSLEALLDFLKASKIPVSGINIGPVHKRDIMRAATMLEKAKELACILCFDVSVDKDAERLAEEMGIRLFRGMRLLCFCIRNTYASRTLQLISSITYLMLSQNTTMKLRKLNEGTQRRRLSGPVVSRSLPHFVNETPLSWASISLMAPYEWVLRWRLSRRMQ
jgi:hypothetical protein